MKKDRGIKAERRNAEAQKIGFEVPRFQGVEGKRFKKLKAESSNVNAER